MNITPEQEFDRESGDPQINTDPYSTVDTLHDHITGIFKREGWGILDCHHPFYLQDARLPEGATKTVAQTATQVDVGFEWFVRSGETIPPHGLWGSYSVYQVKDGKWQVIRNAENTDLPDYSRMTAEEIREQISKVAYMNLKPEGGQQPPSTPHFLHSKPKTTQPETTVGGWTVKSGETWFCRGSFGWAESEIAFIHEGSAYIEYQEGFAPVAGVMKEADGKNYYKPAPDALPSEPEAPWKKRAALWKK